VTGSDEFLKKSPHLKTLDKVRNSFWFLWSRLD
jgi:hypothetical protein